MTGADGLEAWNRVIDLDAAAGTPVAPEVLSAMLDCLDPATAPGNPAGRHARALAAGERVLEATRSVAAWVGAEPEQVLWTSGATESINLAVLGSVRFCLARDRGNHVITAVTEHSATLEACRQLEREGARITWLQPGADGRIEAGQVLSALRDGTVLVTLMHVNNETGAINPIEDIARGLSGHNTLFHVDAAQSAALHPIAVGVGIDLLSLSAHKFHGPAGVGALVLRRRPALHLQPLLFGGDQQGDLRPGTLPVHQVVGMGVAADLARRWRSREQVRLGALRLRCIDRLEAMGGMLVHARTQASPHILNVSVVGVHGDALADALPAVAFARGSACHARDGRPSHVLKALGLPDGLALATLRLSFSRMTRAEDVEAALDRIEEAVRRLRSHSPLWRAYREGVPLDALYRWRVAADAVCAIHGFGGGLQADGFGQAGAVNDGTLVQVGLRLDSRRRVADCIWEWYGGTALAQAVRWLTPRLVGQPVTGLEWPDMRLVAQAVTAGQTSLGALLVLEDALVAARSDALQRLSRQRSAGGVDDNRID